MNRLNEVPGTSPVVQPGWVCMHSVSADFLYSHYIFHCFLWFFISLLHHVVVRAPNIIGRIDGWLNGCIKYSRACECSDRFQRVGHHSSEDIRSRTYLYLMVHLCVHAEEVALRAIYVNGTNERSKMCARNVYDVKVSIHPSTISHTIPPSDWLPDCLAHCGASVLGCALLFLRSCQELML